MTHAQDIIFVESNTTGTGKLFLDSCRALGFRPVLLTRAPDRYHFLTPDVARTIQIDTFSRDAVIGTCAQLGALDGSVAGIWSSSEYFIATAAHAAAALGLCGPDWRQVEAARSKAHQRRLLAKAGVRMPAFAVVSTAGAALDAAAAIGFPVVVKPTAGSGSVGVRLCRDDYDVNVHAACLFGSSATILVEELLVGSEVSVEVFDGKAVGIIDKHLGSPPYFVEIGHDYPSTLAPDIRQEAIALAEDAVNMLGLSWGPAHVEIKLTHTAPALIEVNPRLAGGFIPTLILRATGLDLIAMTLAKVAATEYESRPRSAEFASIRFLLFDEVERAITHNGCSCNEVHCEVVMYPPRLRPNGRSGDFTDRAGHIMTWGTNRDVVVACAECERDELRRRRTHRH